MTILTEALTAINVCETSASLEELRVAWLGKKGRVTEELKTLGSLDAEARKLRGAELNDIKNQITEALDAKKSALAGAELNARLANETIDVTLPPTPTLTGKIHPVTQVIEEIRSIFAELGFSVAEGPDIEDAEHNFDALNIPESHPARQMHDTFYLREQGSASGIQGEAITSRMLNAESLRESIEVALHLLQPFLPHIAEECWQVLGHQDMLINRPWPKADPAFLVDDTVTLAIQINGKTKTTIDLPKDIAKEETEARVLALPQINDALTGKQVKKIIVVPNRIVNIVAG